MTLEGNDLLRIGRLEDKFNLYEPILVDLHGIVPIPDEIGKIQKDLQLLRDSNIAVKEQLTTLFKAQDRVYVEMVKSLEDCPISGIVSKVSNIERDTDMIKILDDRLERAEKAIESFKSKGWDLLLQIIPWAIAICASGWALFKP